MKWQPVGSVAFLLLIGCTAISGPARVENGSGAVTFTGLLSAGDAGVSHRYILQVHGIDTLDRDEYANELLAQFPKHGFKLLSSVDWRDVPLGEPMIVEGPGLKCEIAGCVFDHFGQYEKNIYQRGTETVTVYSYYWRHDARLITNAYLNPDIADNSAPAYRFPSSRKSWLNSMLKAGLMDNGLSDAAEYLSPVGSLERDGLESAVCLMFADAIGTPEARDVPPSHLCLETLAPMVDVDVANSIEFDFLSHSLGSRMLLDVLAPSDPSAGARNSEAIRARKILLRRTRNFFMAANQLPLLVVGDLTVRQAPTGPLGATARSQPAQPQLGLQSVLALRTQNVSARDAAGEQHEVRSTPRLTVLAFQDPDDILGFKASDTSPAADPGEPQILDIVHRNAPQWAYLFEWPASAHDRELYEPHSLKMILCGATSSPDGSLSAARCPNER